ncbi:MgtC/SapB family protein [Lacrimispora sp. 210928-DFI.3.58]|uniref:MgtC/SapB family protein n=1 Tax=Lacrimispora sp. 210928-DFI.3.58 TaxID=2883214 RepID=UPI0015B418EC|nr:MgtC/SapB family protein [Lacrimispora sp. 210928-DFI.3.58]MCB7318200.1 MgtC/SapB family protein [Lacrimispora sp. 210928-DFI.3.58]
MDYLFSFFRSSDILFQLELLLRIILACFLGYIIGYERKSRDKSAGMRTHAIVSLGAALIMIVSKYCFGDIPDYDASRVAAQIVSGVGFLGAGIIFVRNNMVSGLTTAAGIWTTAGVGMAIGAGSYFIGICAGLLVVFIQILLHRIRFLSAEPVRGYVKITTDHFDEVMTDMQAAFNKDKIKMLGFKINKSKPDIKIEFDLLYPSGYDKNSFLLLWSKDPRIHGISG